MTLNPYIEAHELRELVLKKEVRPREVAGGRDRQPDDALTRELPPV